VNAHRNGLGHAGGASAPDARPGPVLALVGPTAAGKTALALALAPRLGAEIVSADAMLVYRGMDIGTAKPTLEERARVPHHLVDVVDPSEDFSVARFQPLARAAIAGVLARGAVPLLVGGSGLYFHAVVDEFVFPPTDAAVRSRLEAEAAEAGLPALYRRLTERDPEAAGRIQPANLRRIVRALEVIELTGRRFSSFRGAMDEPLSRYRLTVLGLDPGPELLRARVAERVASMAAAGLVDEVRRLATGRLSRTARQALGYKELLDALERGAPVEAALDEVVARTRSYARRQLAWFRRDPRVRWGTLPPGPGLEAWARDEFTKGLEGDSSGGVCQGARHRQRLRGRGGPGRSPGADA
jgi:tRNA dimethylallyltransferase